MLFSVVAFININNTIEIHSNKVRGAIFNGCMIFLAFYLFLGKGIDQFHSLS